MRMRRIFGPKREEVAREWRKLHNEELNDLHSFFIILDWGPVPLFAPWKHCSQCG